MGRRRKQTDIEDAIDEAFRDHTQRMTAKEYAEFAARPLPNPADTSAPPFHLLADGPKERMFALGRLKTGELNKQEAAYAKLLDQQLHAGEILWWKFEGIKLRLADNTFLTVDFPVMRSDGLLEMRELKGHWLDDARAKIKIAASMYPFRFLALTPRPKKHGGGYDVEEF